MTRHGLSSGHPDSWLDAIAISACTEMAAFLGLRSLYQGGAMASIFRNAYSNAYSTYDKGEAVLHYNSNLLC